MTVPIRFTHTKLHKRTCLSFTQLYQLLNGTGRSQQLLTDESMSTLGVDGRELEGVLNLLTDLGVRTSVVGVTGVLLVVLVGF